jgi:hypothetical protein
LDAGALQCPLLDPELHCTCPLLGVKRTLRLAVMSAYDPKRTSRPTSA